ncbi:MAG: DinB family protein [Caldilineaceae bacterium]|nr:DinB family protein [Caldilineaceae bacterium]
MAEESNERQQIDALLAQIRLVRQETLATLQDVTENDFSIPTDLKRWDDLRRILLRFGEHMREHTNQLEDARQKTGTGPTMPQRMLAEAERAWGQLLAATVGLTDATASQQPDDGGWSSHRVIEHILEVEQAYLAAAQRALAAQKQEK